MQHNYTGNALFSTTTTVRARGKPRSNSSPNIKGKQKASQENISFPDDGKYFIFFWRAYPSGLTRCCRCMANWKAASSHNYSVTHWWVESGKTRNFSRCIVNQRIQVEQVGYVVEDIKKHYGYWDALSKAEYGCLVNCSVFVFLTLRLYG